MAYLAFDLGYSAGARAASGAAFVHDAASFTPAEWLVIRLARRDGLRSLKPASRLRGLIKAVFGLGPVNPLADPRLEALRRAAICCWHGPRALDREQIDALLEAGFRFDQIALLAGHATGIR